MTPEKADRIIKLGQPVTVRDTTTNRTFIRIFVKRKERTIRTDQGEAYNITNLQLITES